MLSSVQKDQTAFGGRAPLRIVVAIIAASTLVRVIAALSVGLVVDEAYTVGVTRQFQWSWFDHPPLAFWMVHAMQTLSSGEASNLALRAPFIACMSLSILVLYDLTRRVYGENAGVWAVLSFALAPFFLFAAGTWALPDGPLILALLCAVSALYRVLFNNQTRAGTWALWLAAGIAFGLAGLSKYQAAIVLFGALGYMLATPHRRWFGHPAPWVAAGLAALIVSPVFVWNAANGFVSFLFQGGRGAAGGGLRFDQLAIMILGEAAYLLPWTAGGLFLGALAGFKRPGADRFFLALALPVIVLFTLTPLWGDRGLPHWTMPGWLFLFPGLGAWLSAMALRGSPWPRRGVVTSLIVVGFVFAAGSLQASTGLLRSLGLQGQSDPTFETIEWRGLRQALETRGVLKAETFLVSPRWLEAGRIDHALSGTRPVLVADADPRGFAFLIDQRRLLGRDAIIVGTARTMSGIEARLAPHFTALERLPPVPILRNGTVEFTLEVVAASGFRLAFPWPYGKKDGP